VGGDRRLLHTLVSLVRAFAGLAADSMYSYLRIPTTIVLCYSYKGMDMYPGMGILWELNSKSAASGGQAVGGSEWVSGWVSG